MRASLPVSRATQIHAALIAHISLPAQLRGVFTVSTTTTTITTTTTQADGHRYPC